MQGQWPDLDALFAKAKGTEMVKVTDEFKQAVQRLTAFTPDAAPIYIIDGVLSTTQTPDDDGAAIEGFEYVNCALVSNTLRIALKDATHIGFNRYPEPMPFIGTHVRGLMATYRMQASGPEPTQATPPKPKQQQRARSKRWTKQTS
jgi:hypothetical protein